MEVFIQQIDSWVTEEELYKRVAEALHSPPVRLPDSQDLTNFRLLLPKTARNRHKGHAFLTIAEFSTASAFLQTYTSRTGRPLTIQGPGGYNTLKLTPNGYGKEDVIQDIRRYAYEDWEERQRRLRGESDPSPTPSPDSERIEYALAAFHHDPSSSIVPARTERSATSRQQPSSSSRQQARKRADPVVSEGAWSIVQFGVICEDESFSIEDFDSPPSPLPSGFDVKAQVLYFGNKHTRSVSCSTTS